MLRLNFRSARGDSPTLMLAACVRFCEDGTLRGPDNYIIARCVEGAWQIGGRLHRDLDCEGPVSLRLTLNDADGPRKLGPFQLLRTSAGMLYGDDTCLNILVPGRTFQGKAPCRQLTLFSEGVMGGKA